MVLNEKNLKQKAQELDTWRIFRIMAEFVEGFEDLSSIGPAVSIFGSARTEPSNKYYQQTMEIANLLGHPERVRDFSIKSRCFALEHCFEREFSKRVNALTHICGELSLSRSDSHTK